MPHRKEGMHNMNKRKKKAASKQSTSGLKKSKASSNPYRPDPSGGKKGSQFRDRATIKRLNMYNEKPDL